jgi:hypothetical protein
MLWGDGQNARSPAYLRRMEPRSRHTGRYEITLPLSMHLQMQDNRGGHYKTGRIMGFPKINDWSKHEVGWACHSRRIKKGIWQRNKVPGTHGRVHEFYIHFWGVIQTDLLTVHNWILRNRFPPSANFGTIVCVPKCPVPRIMSDYRALTSLNTDYNIYKRVLVQRFSTIFGDINHPSQYCCPWKVTIMDAAAGIRQIVTCAERTQCAICTLSPDFWTAFEKVSHYHLCHIILLLYYWRYLG